MNDEERLDLPKEVADKIAMCLAEARPISDLDGRATTLMLMSITLLGLCLVEQKPTTVQVLGFDLEANNWLWLVTPIAAMIIYLATNLTLCWWTERDRWNFQTLPRLKEALEQMDVISKQYDIRRSGLLDGLPAILSANNGRGPESDPHLLKYPFDWNDPPPTKEVVRDTLKKQVKQTEDSLRSMGWFRYFNEEIWRKQMDISIEHNVAMADLYSIDDDYERDQKIKIEFDEWLDRLRAAGNADQFLDFDQDPDVVANKHAMAFITKAAGMVKTHLRIRWITDRLVLTVPNALALVALGYLAWGFL